MLKLFGVCLFIAIIIFTLSINLENKIYELDIKNAELDKINGELDKQLEELFNRK